MSASDGAGDGLDPDLDLGRHFSASYAQARGRFLAAAAKLGRPAQSHPHPHLRGVDGEELAIDVARFGPADARQVLIVSSGMHGVEGYCGSGCQLALMHDTELLGRFERAGTALVLIHAVNPYGFSHLRRTNEDNVDLNRSFIDFHQPLPDNAPYGEVHQLLLPESWPPTPENEAAIAAFIAKKGELYFRDAVSMGQVTHPDGLFYRGRAPGWSNDTLRAIVRAQGAGAAQIAWIDIHTGLGPTGHGEKIFAGHIEHLPEFHDPKELQRARAFWGADVLSIFGGQSVSRNSRGGGVSSLSIECPWATATTIGLEFGSRDQKQVMLALRGDHWLHNHPQADTAQRRAIKRALLDAFYVDTPQWKGMVVVQTRVCVLQALIGMAAA